jgi:hypothetical protein
MNVAIPPAPTLPVPIAVPPSLNVTIPVGVPVAPPAGVTVAVKVTAWPGVLGLGDDVSVVVVALATTVCVTDAPFELKLMSPL